MQNLFYTNNYYTKLNIANRKGNTIFVIFTVVSLYTGGVTGATARITGAVGDVFAKLSFDNEFINKRQQQKAKPPKMGSKLGGFAKV